MKKTPDVATFFGALGAAIGVPVFLCLVFYVKGYKAGQDGSTLDPAGTVAILAAILVGTLVAIALGAWMAYHDDG